MHVHAYTKRVHAQKDACMQEKRFMHACMKNNECMHDLHQTGDDCMPKNGVHAHMLWMHDCNINCYLSTNESYLRLQIKC